MNKITPDGTVTTPSGRSDGGVAVDRAGNLYVCSLAFQGVFKVPPDGPTTKLTSTDSFCYGIAVDTAGYVYVSAGSFTNNGNGSFFGTTSNIVDKIAPDGKITRVAGGDQAGFSGDGGKATDARLNGNSVLAVDSQGTVYIADGGNERVRVVSPGGTITTLAGNGKYGFTGDNGPATSAVLNQPSGIAVDSKGNLFIADTGNHRVRSVDPSGTISTMAGNGDPTFAGDGGLAPQSSLFLPDGLTVATDGSLFVADAGNNRIRKIGADNKISTLVRTGTNTTGDSFCFLGYTGPAGLALDSEGNLYAADPDPLVRKVLKVATGTGLITDMIGGFSCPYGVAIDPSGNLYVGDRSAVDVSGVPSRQVIRIAPDGTRTVVAKLDFTSNPAGLAADKSGAVYFASASNGNLVRKISPDGTITTVAGGLAPGYSGDGGGSASALLSSPTAVAVDGQGNLFIADTGNNRIREVLALPPPALVTPASFQFASSSGGNIPPKQTILVTSSVPGLAYSATVDAGATWLTVNPAIGTAPRLIEVTADPTSLAPGTYTATIRIATPSAAPPVSSISVTFSVAAAQPPSLNLDKQNLSFPFPRSGKVRSQTITVSNIGGGTLAFTASAQTNSGGNWLSVSPASGQALPTAPVSLTVTADPTGLATGTYTGSVTVAGGTNVQTVPVTVTVSGIDKAILLSQAGLSFLGVSQGGIVPPQSFRVTNIGSGVVNWTVSKSTLSGGPDWLQVGSTAGSTDAASSVVPEVSVSANAASLPAGKYYGQVRVDATDAANSPQVITIFLQVLAPGSDIGAVVQPAELLFTAIATDTSPGSQDVLLYNLTADAKIFRSSVSADPGLQIITLPTDGTLDPQLGNRVVVQPITTGLKPGLYNGNVAFQFSDGRSRSVRVSVAVVPGPVSKPNANRAATILQTDAANCKPTLLRPALNTLGQSFTASAGWPVALGIDIDDDCGVPFDNGSVTVSFSNGDPPLNLKSLKSGHWEATWLTGSASPSVTIRIQASDPQGALKGERLVQGSLQTQTDPPIFDQSSVVSAASGKSYVPLAPGAIFSIYGDRLAQATLPASVAPLPTVLSNTMVLMAGQSVPLFYVSPKQINAQVPYGLNPNTTHQVVVVQGTTYSQPIAVDVAPAQPAVFIDGSVGGGQGIIIAVRVQGSSQVQFEAKPATPARAGDVVVIYCEGLGAVDQSIVTGSVPGPGLARTTNAVQVTIGGKIAPVSFAGLAPGFVGLYQVNATVPDGVTGSALPVLISVAGQTSPPVTMSVQ